MAEPSHKSPALESELVSLLGGSRREAIMADKCMSCGLDATEFRDEISRKEFTISGLCQDCQDSVFGGI